MKKRIMIIEDDQGILDVMKSILDIHGYDVALQSAIPSGKTINNPPDLFILDLWLGRSDGRKICRLLKKGEKTKHIPIMLVSAVTGLSKYAQDCGADDFLEKPFEIKDLVSKVKKLL